MPLVRVNKHSLYDIFKKNNNNNALHSHLMKERLYFTSLQPDLTILQDVACISAFVHEVDFGENSDGPGPWKERANKDRQRNLQHQIRINSMKCTALFMKVSWTSKLNS